MRRREFIVGVAATGAVGSVPVLSGCGAAGRVALARLGPLVRTLLGSMLEGFGGQIGRRMAEATLPSVTDLWKAAESERGLPDDFGFAEIPVASSTTAPMVHAMLVCEYVGSTGAVCATWQHNGEGYGDIALPPVLALGQAELAAQMVKEWKASKPSRKMHEIRQGVREKLAIADYRVVDGSVDDPTVRSVFQAVTERGLSGRPVEVLRVEWYPSDSDGTPFKLIVRRGDTNIDGDFEETHGALEVNFARGDIIEHTAAEA